MTREPAPGNSSRPQHPRPLLLIKQNVGKSGRNFLFPSSAPTRVEAQVKGNSTKSFEVISK
jgi:hypothetical protein